MTTHYAPEERTPEKDLLEQSSRFSTQTLFVETADAFPKFVLVLNRNRQAVFCNTALCDYLGSKREETLGKRPGEIFRCVHSSMEPCGCGTSRFCRFCDAVNSILKAQRGERNSSECRMTVHRDGQNRALDLRVWSVPFEHEGELYTIFTIEDIENEKRREALEKTFFHDVMNEAAILKGYVDDLADGILPFDQETSIRMRRRAASVINTIRSQIDLAAAERNELHLQLCDWPVREFLVDLAAAYTGSRDGEGHRMVVENAFPDARIYTDWSILTRVLGNLLKNAVEASPRKAVIKLRYSQNETSHFFSVHNETVMAESVRAQVFQRSFSTKGHGRGIGTYSAKYFTENYLNGKLTFTSRDGEGTVFVVEVPRSPVSS